MAVTNMLMGRPKKQHRTKHIRVYEDDADMIRIISIRRGMDMAEFVRKFFGDQINSEYAKVIKEMVEDTKKR